MPLKQSRKLTGHRRLLDYQEDDPLSSVANLFDVAMVFAVALLLAMVSHFHLEDLLQSQDVTILKNPGTSKMEIIRVLMSLNDYLLGMPRPAQNPTPTRMIQTRINNRTQGIYCTGAAGSGCCSAGMSSLPSTCSV